MSVSLAADIELRPVTIPVEGDAGLVARVHLFEFIEVHLARRRVGEETESDFVFSIGLREDVVEVGPVLYADAVLVSAIGDLEEDAVLVALDLVLWSCWPSRVFTWVDIEDCAVL